jgi:hypothetical protein
MIGRDPNSGLGKYGPGSVLSGQNIVSGFGTNDYVGQLDKYIEKMMSYATRSKFQQAKLDRAIAEKKAAQEKTMREELAKEEAAKQANIKAQADLKSLTSTASGGGGGGIAANTGGGQQAANMGGGSRQAKSGGQKAGGSGRTDGGWGWADGGRVGYNDGGDVEAPNPRVLELMLNEKMSYEEALKEYKNRMKQQPYIDERYNMGPEPILEAAYGGRVGFKKGGLATMFKLKG